MKGDLFHMMKENKLRYISTTTPTSAPDSHHGLISPMKSPTEN
jgi:hypothetical protein